MSTRQKKPPHPHPDTATDPGSVFAQAILPLFAR